VIDSIAASLLHLVASGSLGGTYVILLLSGHMGIWSDEIINSDSTLELAMVMLTACGVGPHDYAERQKTFAVVVNRSPLFVFAGRHTAEEYFEFEECLRAAAGCLAELEAHADELMDICNRAPRIRDQDGETEGGRDVGNGAIVLTVLLMQAGVQIGDSFKTYLQRSIGIDTKSGEPHSGFRRRMILRQLFALVGQYPTDGSHAFTIPSRTWEECVIANAQKGAYVDWHQAGHAMMERVTVRHIHREGSPPSSLFNNNNVRTVAAQFKLSGGSVGSTEQEPTRMTGVAGSPLSASEVAAYTEVLRRSREQSQADKSFQMWSDTEIAAGIVVGGDIQSPAKVAPNEHDVEPMPESEEVPQYANKSAEKAARADKRAKKLSALDDKLTAEDKAAIRAAIEAAGGLDLLAEQAPLTSELICQLVANDLHRGAFDADAYCWGCGKWSLVHEVIFGHSRHDFRVLKCQACKKARYCSKECQKKDWPDHKSWCKDNRPGGK
jgi:hypothetical protein